MNQTKRDPNAIYDRHGNRIRIWVGNDEEEKEIDAKTYNLIFAPGIKYRLPYLIFKYPKLLILLTRRNVSDEIKKYLVSNEIINKICYFKIQINNKKIKINFNDGFGLLTEININDQYEAYSSHLKNKIIIDAGANVGAFSLYASMLGAKKVYAFEPVKETYDILVKNIKMNKLENKVIPINKALGDKNETKTISFMNAGDGGASLKEERKKGKREEIISIIKLDDFVKENKIKRVDFIKMDVEGYEENVLLGAKETIKKWKPILSFSAYHLPTDKERLPKVVLSIRPDYKIKLNKYAEEDFYCE